MPKTKIVCTVGPASEKKETLLKMARAGMSVMRMNFSHGSHEEHLGHIWRIREINKKYKKNIKILGDLEGYRIRIGRLKDSEPIKVKKGETVWLTQKNIKGSGNLLPFDYDGPINRIKKGMHVFIDDGNIGLEVLGIEKNKVKARAVIQGVIKERKGIIIPDLKIDMQGLDSKDKSDIDFCVENEVDFIAQSFVRRREDIMAIREYMGGQKHGIGLIAKIENQDGIKNIDSIIGVCDGIMVARGDMGVSLPIYEVPVMQKIIIKKCNKAKKFVITATQMLESMVENHIPTRAEVCDVANAILDGTDYVMLSAETAAGQYPDICVEMMSNVIKYTEKHETQVG